MALGINLVCLPDTQEEAVHVVEVLARAATGLAFDGLTTTLSFTTYDPSD
jgi:hypothetical protein